MVKSAINKILKLNANGILAIDENVICIENPDTGEMIDLRELLCDFLNKPIEFSISYDYEYDI